MKEAWKHCFVKADGIRMHYVTQGEVKLLLFYFLDCSCSRVEYVFLFPLAD